MNTERPDNDDTARERGAAETAGAEEVRGDEDRVRPRGGENRAEAREEERAEAPGGGDGEEAREEKRAKAPGDGNRALAEEVRAPAQPDADGDGDGDGDETREEKREGNREEVGAKAAPPEVPAAAHAEEVGLAEEGLAGGTAGKDHADEATADQDRDRDGTHEGGAGRPAGRRRSPVVVASVAAAVLLVGGGGAYLAAGASGGSGGGKDSGSGMPAGDDGNPPPLALDGYTEGGAGSSGGSNGIAPGEPNPYGVTYRAAGTLPEGPGSAPVYWATGTVTKDEVARLAESLGVDGTPVARGEVWKVGTGKDGAGPMLQVSKEAPGTWTFSRYAPGTDNCRSTVVCEQDPAAPADDPVSEAAAKKAAAPVLKALDQDDAKIDASQVMGAQRVVNADPLVGGLPTSGLTTGLTVNTQGEVVGGNGRLNTPAKGDTYPVLSARETLDLMNAAPGSTAHRMGIGGCASPVPLKDRLEEPCGSSSASTAAPGGDRQTITVEDAVLGLTVRGANGRQALVPSWLFEARGSGAQDDFTVTYPAVDPKYLTPAPSATAPEPTAAPTSYDVKVDGYTAEGRELTVSYTGGVCADYDAKAVESSDKVTVKVTGKPWPNKICIKIAKLFHQTVRLDQPLGDRKVVGSDGKDVPLEKAGARLPR
ncbi:hypothetical protein ACFV0T_36585 [Streptomyces sp. NPDC059582]|uniref:hypothetical protein n=1 Tax=Streptomyces sp. NPDC059582 TaxID=3346875 RepID=UPI003699D674